MCNRRILILLLVLCAAVLLSACHGSVQNDTQAPSADTSEPSKDPGFQENQSASVRQYNGLLDYYTKTYGDAQYPDYYGGAYIDEGSGKLIVLVTDMEAAKEDLSGWNAPFEDFQQCEYSYNQLEATRRTIMDQLMSLLEQGASIRGSAVDIKTGRVIIYVDELTEEGKEAILTLAGDARACVDVLDS